MGGGDPSLLVLVRNGDSRAFRGQLERCGPADPRSAASDQRYTTREPALVAHVLLLAPRDAGRRRQLMPAAPAS